MLMPSCCVPFHFALVEKIDSYDHNKKLNLHVLPNLTSTRRVVTCFDL